MNGVVRRRVMNKPEEKGPIINTYEVSASVTSSNTFITYAWWDTITWKIGATYTFNIKFDKRCTHIRLYLGNSQITVGNISGPTGTLTWTCTIIPSINKIEALLRQPIANGTITINITESIPRT